MSDDEADPELLALLAQSLGLGPKQEAPPSTGVLQSVEYVYDNALDVSISSQGTKGAAELLYHQLQRRQYSTREWSRHELHPKPSGGEATVNFIFTMNLLNFSFWSELPEPDRFTIEHAGKRWTGYWSLVAALQRALDEGLPMTTPSFWATCSDETFSHIFRSATAEPIPLLPERIQTLRTASSIWSDPDTSPLQMILDANHSAARLVNLLTNHLPSCFDDTSFYNGKPIHLHKRAQILVADLWACFNGASYGDFDDIDSSLTMFADYRVPQMLQRLGVLWYSPRLEGRVRRGEVLESGETLELEVRACSVWAVELLKREMARKGWNRWEAEVDVDESDDTEQEHVGEAAAGEQATAVAADEDPAKEGANSPGAHPPVGAELPVEKQNGRPVEESGLPQPEEEEAAADPETTEAPDESTAAAPAPATTITATPQQPPAPSPPARPKPTQKITVHLNAILLDYLLYDTAKEQEAQLLAAAGDDAGPDGPRVLPHHRTRSIWY